ncbi:VOC family protein [Saccharopolyspora sp. 5N102]|uniref:VOC family protein n=1 Tax=Saccharopolyspora sp. 5N102 TaxID=3375155 RepID=UPI003794E1A1
MNLTHLKRVSIPVSDQDKAKAFYSETLGFNVLLDLPTPMGENSRWIEVAPDGAATSLILANWLPNMSPGGVGGLMIETTDLAADVAAISAAGVEVEGPFDTPFGKQATFADPDGNGYVLVQHGEEQG